VIKEGNSPTEINKRRGLKKVERLGEDIC